MINIEIRNVLINIVRNYDGNFNMNDKRIGIIVKTLIHEVIIEVEIKANAKWMIRENKAGLIHEGLIK